MYGVIGNVDKREIEGFLYQAENDIRFAQESRGLGDVYMKQHKNAGAPTTGAAGGSFAAPPAVAPLLRLLYTSYAADEPLFLHRGVRRCINKKITRLLSSSSAPFN